MSEVSSVDNELMAGKSVVVFTHGTSMLPLIKEGRDHVLISPVRTPLKKGDIAIFKRDESTYVLHRLIKIKDDFCYTRGDHCIHCERVPKNKILGKVVKIYRKGKEVSVDGKGYKAYCLFWRIITPFRITYSYSKGKIYGLLRKIKSLFR